MSDITAAQATALANAKVAADRAAFLQSIVATIQTQASFGFYSIQAASTYQDAQLEALLTARGFSFTYSAGSYTITWPQ